MIYRWISLGIGVSLLTLAAFTWWLPSILPLQQPLDISYFTGFLCILLIGFALVGYPNVARKTTHWEAMLIQIIIQAMTVFSIAQTTGGIDSPFMILWGILCLSGGMFGIYGSAGETLISVLYFIAASNNQAGGPHYTTQQFLILWTYRSSNCWPVLLAAILCRPRNRTTRCIVGRA